MKQLEEKVLRRHFDVNYSKIFFDPPTKIMKNKIWDLIRRFCIAKGSINKKKI